MNFFERRIHSLDKLQRSSNVTSFPIAVIKKYGEDKGGYQAALLTYYGFLSLFPAVLIIVTLVRWFLGSNTHLKQSIINSITNYFPLIGGDLQQNLGGFSQTGLPLLIGIVVLFYGLRGAADVFRHTVNNVWRVPEEDRSGFFPALGRSALIVGIAGAGFLVSAILNGYATAARHDIWLRIILVLGSSLALFVAFLFATKTALNRKARRRQLWAGAATTTIGLGILQNVGGYILAHELKNLNSLYGAFAAVLAFFFWIYLQSQVIVYSMEIITVRVLGLWPRKLIGEDNKPWQTQQTKLPR